MVLIGFRSWRLSVAKGTTVCWPAWDVIRILKKVKSCPLRIANSIICTSSIRKMRSITSISTEVRQRRRKSATPFAILFPGSFSKNRHGIKTTRLRVRFHPHPVRLADRRWGHRRLPDSRGSHLVNLVNPVQKSGCSVTQPQPISASLKTAMKAMASRMSSCSMREHGQSRASSSQARMSSRCSRLKTLRLSRFCSVSHSHLK